MAEGLAKKVFSREGDSDYEFSSAGTSALDGMPASEWSAAVASENGVDLSGHRSRLLNRTMVRNADLIVAMGAKHRDTVGVVHPEALEYTVLLAEFGDGNFGDVPDPIGGGRSVYQQTFDMIKSCVDGMAASLADFNGWKKK